MARRDHLAGALLVFCLGGCQWVGGFQEFEESTTPGASGAGGAGENAGSGGGAGSGGDSGSGGAAGEAGSGQEACVPSSFRCSGAILQICREDGVGFDPLETCASEVLCKTGEEAGKCTPPACGEGSLDPATGGALPKNRCRDGDLEVCAEDQQQYASTDCGSKQCNPGAGQCVELGIDPVEVTRGAYKEFLTDAPQVPVPAVCEGNDRAPDAACMADPSVCQESEGPCDDTPQVCVDWCDALAYCRSKGKQLCGAVGDAATMVPLQDHASAGKSAWMNACSAGGQYTWVVGDTWDDLTEGQLCNGSVKKRNPGTADVFPAGKLTACSSPVGAYKNVYDLAGNVAEWENSCERPGDDKEATSEDNCRVRGGSFLSEKPKLRCDADRTEKRDARLPDVGFRCCE